MYSQGLDISIDVAYQEAIKQIISSGALDISTEAYTSALALSAGRTPVVSPPRRSDITTDVYLSAPPQDSYDVCSTPESKTSPLQTQSRNSSQGSSKRSHLITPATTSRRHHQRNSDIIARFQRDSAHISGIDHSLLSYSALGTPNRQSTNSKNCNQISRDRVREQKSRRKISGSHKSISSERQSARELLAKLGLTPDNVSSSEYDELLSLLLALRSRNFCDLNRILSLFPYNAALNSMCASLKSADVREKLVDILRPTVSHNSPPISCPDPLQNKIVKSSRKRSRKRSKPGVGVQAAQLTSDIIEPSVSSSSSHNKTAVSTPGLDFYLNMATSALNEHSSINSLSTQTTQTEHSTYLDQSESGGDGLSHQSLQTSTTLTFNAAQDELANLREMNAKLMQSHDFVVHELDHVTMQLNKEMEKTAKLQALILEKAAGSQGHTTVSPWDGSLSHARSSSAPTREPTQECTNFIDRAVSCYLTERQYGLTTTFTDKSVQVLTSATHSIGTSPHASFACVVPPPLHRSMCGSEHLHRRSTAEFIPAVSSDKGTEAKQRSNSVVNLSLVSASQNAALQLSAANLDLSALDLSPRSPNATNVELTGSFNSVDSMLDLIAGYIGTNSTELKNQITLSYSLAQLFRIGWYDTPCTQLASIALLDIDLFETGDLVHEVPDAVEEFISESYATSFGSFFVRPYDHSLLTLLLLCVYPAMMFQFAGAAASFLAPILHDVDKSTLDDYSNGCILFSSLLGLTEAVGSYLEKRNLESLVSSVQTLLQTIKDFTGEIETSCLLPVVLTLVRIVVSKTDQRALVSSLSESIIVTNDKIYEIFIAILSQVLKKITTKIMSNDDEESTITPEQQIALRMIWLAVQTLAPLKQVAV